MVKVNSNKEPSKPIQRFECSALFIVLGIILLFSTAIIAVLIAPRYIDATWVSPSSPFQLQMYEMQVPNFYMSTVSTGGRELQYVQHLKQDVTLLLFKESKKERIVAPAELEKYITKYRDSDTRIKLTSRLLLLRTPEGGMVERANELQKKLMDESMQETHAMASKNEEKLSATEAAKSEKNELMQ